MLVPGGAHRSYASGQVLAKLIIARLLLRKKALPLGRAFFLIKGKLKID